MILEIFDIKTIVEVQDDGLNVDLIHQNFIVEINDGAFVVVGSGLDGKTILSGAGAPSALAGTAGDFYIDTDANEIYGPKSGGSWGAGTSIIGPAGPGFAAGGAVGQILRKASGEDYETEWFTPGSFISKDYWEGTQEEFDAIVTKDPNTVYFII